MKRKCVSYHVKCATVDTVSHPQETGPVGLVLDWYPQMIRFSLVEVSKRSVPK